MFTSSSLTLNPPIYAAATTPLLSSPKSPLSPPFPLSPRPLSTAASLRRMTVTAASVSTCLESVPVNSRRAMSLYEILRIKQTASLMEIKTAYRSLAKLYHPDAAVREDVETDGRDFMEIHNAYETLSDPAARALYDLSLDAASRRRRPAVGFTGGYYPTRRWETDQCW
ncbi:chaperone protein dnaJ 11, chloroplastic [Ricinus communis]|uniref:chaperone protein dnaJ 11, chloroplastic n=1 Tax=Ricinus communis TaxID=3988 RepID=UPI00201A7A2F|nr:chaperone protein dnaJ 11, chloroplastic [Ricinus communis]